jgi:hypothetical protein
VSAYEAQAAKHVEALNQMTAQAAATVQSMSKNVEASEAAAKRQLATTEAETVSLQTRYAALVAQQKADAEETARALAAEKEARAEEKREMAAIISESTPLGGKIVELQAELEAAKQESLDQQAELEAISAGSTGDSGSGTRDCSYEIAENEPSDVLSEWKFAELVSNHIIARHSPRVYIEGLEDWSTLGEIHTAVDHSTLSLGIVHILTCTLPQAEARLQEMASLREETEAARAVAAHCSGLLERYKRIGAAAAEAGKDAEEGTPPLSAQRRTAAGLHGLSSEGKRHPGGGSSRANTIGLGIDDMTGSPESRVLRKVSKKDPSETWLSSARRTVKDEAHRSASKKAELVVDQMLERGLQSGPLEPEPEPEPEPQPQPTQATTSQPSSSDYTGSEHSYTGSEFAPHVVRISSQYVRHSSSSVTKWGDHDSGLVASDRHIRAASNSSTRLIEQMRRDRESRERRTKEAVRRHGR